MKHTSKITKPKFYILTIYIYIYEYYKKIKTKIKMNKPYLPNYVAFFFLSSIKIKFFTWLHKSWITNLI